MEEILKSLANENGLLPLILIATISVMVFLYKYGGDIMKLFKRENKKEESESKYEALVHKVLEDGKSREEKFEEREKSIQRTLEDATRTNKELSETNAKLADMISIRIDNIEEDVRDVKEDMKDVKDSLIVIKTRTEK